MLFAAALTAIVIKKHHIVLTGDLHREGICAVSIRRDDSDPNNPRGCRALPSGIGNAA